MIDLKFELPTYQVKLPQTLLELEVESLTIADENMIKSSIVNNKGITSLINSVLYNKIRKRDDLPFDNYDKFLEVVTTNDREALLSALYHVTYGDEFKTETTCPACGTLNENKVSLPNIGRINFYEGKPLEILEKEVQIDIQVGKDVSKIFLKVPTLKKELDLFDFLSQHEPLFMYGTFIFVDRIEYKDKVFSVQENPYDVLAFLSILPAKDRQIINKKVKENFAKYKLDLPYKVECAKCKHIFTSYINFLDQLFRMALESEE